MRILVCIDHSPLSDRVVAEAAVLARVSGAELVLLHAARTDPAIASGGVAGPQGHVVVPGDMTERRDDMQVRMERLRGEGLKVEGEVKLCEDTLHEFVIREADAIGASYIVIGSHGHGRLFELLLGSVTQGVIREARMPVLVVPAHGPVEGAAKT